MRKIAVLCDFDGTVAQDDVGNLLFRTFADEALSLPVIEQWKKGEISSRECLEREVSLAEVSPGELDRFVNQRKLDPYFKDFVDFARRSHIEVVIVSDGLDYYVEKMLMRSGLGELEYYANTLEFNGGNLSVSFPHYDRRDCRDCGNCKTYHLSRYKDEGYYIVYVGNGLSDRCPSEYSELVFAKGDLLDFCKTKGVDFVEFKNFRDVERELVQRFVMRETRPEGEGVGGL
ncbi:MAG: MtnX-like HAD-IB family phosphatase [Candidatus Krumholzibacteriia bacterium]